MKRFRGTTGNTMVMIILTICFLIVPLVIIFGQMSLQSVDRERVQNIVDAAGLVAANDLSKIAINDPNFGYVSLSNYPPTGTGTLAADGEPLPVLGINTLVGTIRQNTIISHQLANDTMIALADADRKNLDSTIIELNSALTRAVTKNNKLPCFGTTGQKVDPVRDAQAFLAANLPSNVRLVSMELSNGWLTGGGSTTISIPQPESLAEIKPASCQAGNYRPFIDAPAFNRSFSFAGVGTSSTLVTATQFHQSDNKHIGSIVRIECVFAATNPCQLVTGIDAGSKLKIVACCQPFSLPDMCPEGAMTVKFSGRPVPGLLSWNDFVRNGNFHDRQINTYDVVGGDYAKDRDARMRQFQPDNAASTTQQFAEHMYCWLRNAHMRPRIDSVLAMMNDSFDTTPNQIYQYQIAKDGTITRNSIKKDPFPVGVISDAQSSAVADTRVRNDVNPVIVFRNNVKRLGTAYGGKHAGQPLSESRTIAYNRGSAVDIEIGGTRESTAWMDVARMRRLNR